MTESGDATYSVKPLQVDSYETIPYEGNSFNFTHPDVLSVVGAIFGLTPPDYRKCRVLEIGCGIGVNALSIASRFPEISVTALDVSANQIKIGKRIQQDAGIKNIELKELSILDFPAVVNEEFAAYDFIIAHGVYSWVPEPVRDKLLQICGSHLTAQGIAFISYNVLPGWNMVRSLRELLIYHAGHIADPNERAQQAGSILAFLRDGVGQLQSPYAEFVRQELKLLDGISLRYFLHDHLSYHNEPCYFHQFMSNAIRCGLQYVGDMDLSSMYVGNFNEKTQKALSRIDDILHAEQYMDFLHNRRFRRTALCRMGANLNRKIDFASVSNFAFSTTLVPDATKYKKVDLTQKDAERQHAFLHQEKLNVSVHGDIPAALFLVLAEKHQALPVREICQRVADKVQTSLDSVKAILEPLLGRYIFQGVLIPHMEPFDLEGTPVLKKGALLSAFPLARAQSLLGDIVTNTLGNNIKIDDFARVVLRLLDGTRNQNTLVVALVKMVRENKLAIQQNEHSKEKLDIKKSVTSNVEKRIAFFLENHLVK